MVYVWVFAGSVFVAGLLLTALLLLRAFRQVKLLGRTVADASTRIADATAAIEALAPAERGARGDYADADPYGTGRGRERR